MKLYSRPLRSMDDLRREKDVLKYAKKHIATEDLISIKNVSKPDDTLTGKPDWMSLASGVLTSRTMLDGVLTVALPLLRYLPKKNQKNILTTFARELFGGYIRWKAIQISYRVGKSVLKNIKERKREKNA